MPYTPPKHDPNDISLPGIPLKMWLDIHGLSYRQFAKMVPCAANYPGVLARGEQQPSYNMAQRIEELTGGQVPRTRWYPAPEPVKEQSISDMLKDLIDE